MKRGFPSSHRSVFRGESMLDCYMLLVEKLRQGMTR